MVDGEDEVYQSYLKGERTDLKQFYTMMREGKVFKTSLPNLAESEALFRELLGSGTFGKGVLSADGVRILPSQYPAMLMILPVGGFLTLACLIAFTQWFNRHLAEKAAKKEAEAK